MRGHTAFAYVIGGKGLFCDESGPFAYDVRGVNYFDLKRDRFIANGTALLFGDGDCVTASAEEEQLRFLRCQANRSPSPSPGMARSS
jgi:quercetin 2,3-dioxygenase